MKNIIIILTLVLILSSFAIGENTLSQEQWAKLEITTKGNVELIDGQVNIGKGGSAEFRGNVNANLNGGTIKLGEESEGAITGGGEGGKIKTASGREIILGAGSSVEIINGEVVAKLGDGSIKATGFSAIYKKDESIQLISTEDMTIAGSTVSPSKKGEKFSATYSNGQISVEHGKKELSFEIPGLIWGETKPVEVEGSFSIPVKQESAELVKVSVGKDTEIRTSAGVFNFYGNHQVEIGPSYLEKGKINVWVSSEDKPNFVVAINNKGKLNQYRVKEGRTTLLPSPPNAAAPTTQDKLNLFINNIERTLTQSEEQTTYGNKKKEVGVVTNLKNKLKKKVADLDPFKDLRRALEGTQ